MLIDELADALGVVLELDPVAGPGEPAGFDDGEDDVLRRIDFAELADLGRDVLDVVAAN